VSGSSVPGVDYRLHDQVAVVSAAVGIAIVVLVVLLALLLLRAAADQTRALRMFCTSGSGRLVGRPSALMGTAVTDVQRLPPGPEAARHDRRGLAQRSCCDRFSRPPLPDAACVSTVRGGRGLRSATAWSCGREVSARGVPALSPATAPKRARGARVSPRTLKERIDEIADKYIRREGV